MNIKRRSTMEVTSIKEVTSELEREFANPQVIFWEDTILYRLKQGATISGLLEEFKDYRLLVRILEYLEEHFLIER